MLSFATQMSSDLLVIGTARVLSRRSFLVPTNLSIFPILSSIRFRVSGLILKSLIHVELSFVTVEE